MDESEGFTLQEAYALTVQQETTLDSAMRYTLDRLNAARNTLECDVLQIRKVVIKGDTVSFYAPKREHRTLESISNSGGAPGNWISDLDIANIAFSVLLAIERLSSAKFYLSTVNSSNIFYKPGETPFLGDIELLLVSEENHDLLSITPPIHGLGVALYKLYTGEYLGATSEFVPSSLNDNKVSCNQRVLNLIQLLLTYDDYQSLNELQDKLISEFSSVKITSNQQNRQLISYAQHDFFKAVESDNIGIVQELSASFARSTNETGNTALMTAAKRLSLTIVRLLAPFECGEVHSITGNTALHYVMMRPTFQASKQMSDDLCSHSAFEEFMIAQIIRILAPQEGQIRNAAGELPISIGISHSYPNSIIRLLLPYSGDLPKVPDTLIESVRNNDVISAYLNIGQIGRVDEFGNTALAYAIASKNLVCVKLLLAEKDISVATGITPWQLARDNDFVDALSSLEQTPVVDTDGNTQLHRAAMEGNILNVRLFLSLARKKNNDGYTALMLSAALKHKDIVCLLRNYETGEQDNNGHTALHQSCLHGREDMALLLLEHEKHILSGASLKQSRPCNIEGIHSRLLGQGISAAEMAFYTGNIDLSKSLLLPEHIVTSPPDKKGRTNLMLGALSNDPFMVFCYLGQAGLVDNDGFTALMHASTYGYLQCAVLLAPLEAGITVSVGERCLGAIDFAVLNEFFNVAEVVAEYELIVPNAEKYPSDMTQLMIAAAERRPGLVWFYIDQINIRDNKGWVALMHAVEAKDEDCVKLLLKERDIVTEDGITAWYLAYKIQEPNLCSILRPSYTVNSEGETPLHTYVRLYATSDNIVQRRANLLAVLHCYGERNNDGYTALMLAAILGHTDIDEDLMKLEGGLMTKENIGTQKYCASLLALKEGHLDTFRLISSFEAEALFSYGHTKLIISAISGDIKGVTQFLSDACQQDHNGWSALMYAVKYKFKHIVAILAPLESFLINSAGELATDVALDNDFLEGAILTLRYEFSSYSNGLLGLAFIETIIARNWDGDLALLKAMLRPSEATPEENTEFIRQLVHKHPNSTDFTKIADQLRESLTALNQYILHPAFEDENGHTQLHVEAMKSNIEGIRACMHLVRKRNIQGQTALMLAAAAGNMDVINILVNVEGGLQDTTGLVATDYALDRGEFKAAATLLHCKEEFRRISCNGFTPLMAAVINENLELVKENICFCQNVYRRKYSALTLAIRLENIDVIDVLRIEANITVEGMLPWRLATDLGLVEIASMIKPVIKCEDGVTELHKAAMNSDQESAKEFLHEAGVIDPTGRTALIIAIEKGLIGIVAVLAPLEHSISFVGRWSSGAWTFDSPSPLLIATCMQYNDICKILIQQSAGFTPTICDKNGLTPLMVAAGMGNVTLATLYYPTQRGMADRSGNTALMWATKQSQSISAALLCDEAGRLNLDGDCALVFALDRCDIKSISLLAEKETRLLTKEFVSSIQNMKILSMLPDLNTLFNNGNLKEDMSINSVGIKSSRGRSASTSLLHAARMYTFTYTPSPSTSATSTSLVIRESQRNSSLRPLTPSFIFTKN